MIKNKEIKNILNKLEKLVFISQKNTPETGEYLNKVLNSFKYDFDNKKLRMEEIKDFKKSFNKSLNWVEISREENIIWKELYELLNDIEKSPND